MNPFLPMTTDEVRKRGWNELDIILVSGDAYVDHPSYGVSIIGRLLESRGYRVGIIAQPQWQNTEDFIRLGKPRLFFGITAGNVDSMVANYSGNKRPRKLDDYSPGQKSGMRPDRAIIVYTNRIREAFGPTAPIVIGGIEASLRRIAHYDFWDNKVRRSLLLDSRADILIYGMGERQCLEIADRLNAGEDIRQLDGIKGTAVIRKSADPILQKISLPAFEEVTSDKNKFMEAFQLSYPQMNPANNLTLVQPHGDRVVIVNPPALPLSQKDLDLIYELPFNRSWHPQYDRQGGIKGFETVRFSITAHRGCCGECSFCALYFHQGRIVQSRSKESIIKEAKNISQRKDFHGTITDIGGPTANMFTAQCTKWKQNSFCDDRSCLHPKICKDLHFEYDSTISLFQEIENIPEINHLFIGSGLRYDLLLSPKALPYINQICERQISGILKIAPEHCAEGVLKLMNKPVFESYEKFIALFNSTIKKLGKKLFVVNYFISAHPGTSLDDTLQLSLYLVQRGIKPEQIQDFLPSPMTRSTCMYYTKKDPLTGADVCVTETTEERQMHRALIQYDQPKNFLLLKKALQRLNKISLLPLFSQKKPYEKKKKY